MSNILLIGANHAGTAAANTILDNYKDQNLTIIDRNNNISYLGCGTALWIGKQIDDYHGLFYSSSEILTQKGAKVLMETEVEHIDFEAKKVSVVNKERGREILSYDKLIIATGSQPIVPRIPGVELGNIQSIKLFQDGQKANELLDDPSIKSVAVVGAGYIGVELVEAICRRGKKAYLFEAESTCLPGYYDEWLTKDMDKVLQDNGVELHYNEPVKEFKGNKKLSSLVTDKGEYQVEMAIMSIGFLPNSKLAKDKLTTIKNGAYLVNLRQETSIPDVYAIGDCATVYSNALQDNTYIALATNAVRSGVVAGHNVCGAFMESPGVQGSNGISIFGYNMVSTGLSLKSAERLGYHALAADYEDLQRPEFMKENNSVKIRIVYEAENRRILGAQMASHADISMGIHMFSLAIEEKLTIDQLKLFDVFFQPHFNKPFNYINLAALSAGSGK